MRISSNFKLFSLLRNPMLFSAGMYSLTSALLKAVTFLIFIWLAASLSIEGYADFGILYALQSGFVIFTSTSVANTIVGKLRQNTSESQRTYLFGLAVTTFFGYLICVFLFLLSCMYISGIDISYARVASVSVSGVALAYSSLQAQLYRLDQKHFKSNHFAFIAPLFGICAAGMCFLFLNSLESYFFGMAIGLVLSMVVLRSAGTTGYSPCFDREKTGALLVKGLPFLAMGIVGWFQGYGNNIVIVSLFEKEHVAVFTFVLTIAGVVQLVANGTNQVWSPFFYSKHDQIPSEELENGNHNFYNIQSFGLGVVGAILLTLYPNLLKFFGLGLPQYGNIQLQLALIACVYVISTPWWQCSNYYYAEGRSTELLKIVLFSGVIGIPLWIVIMVQFGPIGIYVGYLVNLMLRTILIVWLAKKIWTIRISWLGMVLGTASIYLAYRHAI